MKNAIPPSAITKYGSLRCHTSGGIGLQEREDHCMFRLSPVVMLQADTTDHARVVSTEGDLPFLIPPYQINPTPSFHKYASIN